MRDSGWKTEVERAIFIQCRWCESSKGFLGIGAWSFAVGLHCLHALHIDWCLLLKLHVKMTNEKKETESFIAETDSLSLPCELIDHGQNVRPVAELKDFKANEFFNYVFHLEAILLRGRIPAPTYHHYLNLVLRFQFLISWNWHTSSWSTFR